MDLLEIGNLLEKIAVHYPAFRKNVSDGCGNMRRDVAEEWMRIIGFLSFQEALDRLDVYMETNETGKPPMAMDFRRYKPRQMSDEWHSPEQHVWHLEFPKWDQYCQHGRLYDQEDREYVHDPTYEDGYHYDKYGRICTIDGRVVYR